MSYNPSMAERKARLFGRLCDPGELERAWGDVLAHYSRERLPTELREFDRHRGRGVQRIADSLRAGSFVPDAASLIYIPKPGHAGEFRPISLVRPDDRIVLTALNRLLAPLFERHFPAHSYAYRPGLGAWPAVERVSLCLGQGLIHIAAGDIDNFFASLDRSQVLAAVRRIIFEQPVLDLLETYLHIGSTHHLEWEDTGRGIAQGSPLSPVLSNLALLEFDRFLAHCPAEAIRYADNFLLLAQDPASARDSFGRAEAFLLERCGLHLNPESREFADGDAEGFEFLGFWFRDGRRTMSPKKLEQKKLRLADILRRNPGDLAAMVRELKESIQGWRVYYGRSPDTAGQLEMLEQHLAELLEDWLRRFRQQGGTKTLSAVELKAALSELVLPSTTEPRRKLKWIELALARSRPGKEEARPGISAVARRAIEQRKKQYRRLKQQREEVVVTRPGTHLGRTGERLLIRFEGRRESELPFSLVRNITILTRAVSLSGELMAEAAGRGIPIVIAGTDGRPVVRIGAPETASHERSLAQSLLATGPAGLELARTIVAGKIRNQVNLLRYYLKYPERRADGDFLGLANRAIREMEATRESVLSRVFGADLELERNRLFAAEGQAASSYWSAVRSLLWWKPGFTGRVRRGAGDLVNSLLNYGYGILYSRLMNVLVGAGLNVYIGFLHKPQKGKAGLLYDFIEEFRTAAVDRTVFSLLNLGVEAAVSADGLSLETRHQLARKVVERLQTDTRYHGESLALEQVMRLQAERLARHMEGKDVYQTYVLPW